MKNVCIVGFGAIAPLHANAISKTDNARLYAACDVNCEALELAKTKYNVIGFSDFDTMLLCDKIDSVHICTPHYLHFEMIKKALEAGKAVVCEKPVTRTKEEFDKLLKLPDSDRLCVVFQNRLNLCTLKLKALISSGYLGNIKAVKGVLTWCREREYYQNSPWRGTVELEGGSTLINQSIHTLDLMIYLTGRVSSLKASMTNFSLGDIIETEDTVVSRLKFANGHIGLFYATNGYSAHPLPLIEVVGDKASAVYSDKILYVDGEIICRDEEIVASKKYWGDSHSTLIKNFYDDNISISVNDVADTMQAVFAMYESAIEDSRLISL